MTIWSLLAQSKPKSQQNVGMCTGWLETVSRRWTPDGMQQPSKTMRQNRDYQFRGAAKELHNRTRSRFRTPVLLPIIRRRLPPPAAAVYGYTVSPPPSALPISPALPSLFFSRCNQDWNNPMQQASPTTRTAHPVPRPDAIHFAVRTSGGDGSRVLVVRRRRREAAALPAAQQRVQRRVGA